MYVLSMNLTTIRQIQSHKGCNTFLAKAYGLELLLLLKHFELEGSEKGIDETFDAIEGHRPRRAAFETFISNLESLGTLTKEPSNAKASKKLLRLSKDISDFLD